MTTSKKDLDKYIYDLKYDRNDVLAYTGDQIHKPAVSSDSKKDDTYNVTHKTKKTIKNGLTDLGVVSNLGGSIYPGSVLLANSDLVEGNPAEVSCKKNPINVRISLPNLKKEETNIVTIENPKASNVLEAIDKVSTKWLDKIKEDPSLSTYALIQSNNKETFSEEQIACELGVEIKKISSKLDLGAKLSSKKHTITYFIKQIYYSASIDAPENPSDLIDDSIDNLKNKGVNEKNPPLYVSNVDFGRLIYITLATNENITSFKEAFEALIKGVNIKQKAQYEKTLKDTDFNMVVIGGGVGSFLDKETPVATVSSSKSNYDIIYKIINEGYKFSSDSPGFPISYATKFLKDNAIGKINSTSDYYESETETHKKCKLTVKNSAAYVGRFCVDYEELSVKDGVPVVEKKHKDWKKVTAGDKVEMIFDANTQNIKVTGQAAVFIKTWRDAYQDYIPIDKNVILTFKGTTYSGRRMDVEHSGY